MALSNFQLLRGPNQPPGFEGSLLLTCFDGANTCLVSIARADVDHYAQQQLPPDHQLDLIERNLETLAPVIAGKYERGEVATHTDRRTGRVMPLIQLTRSDLEQGLRRYPVSSSSPIPIEALSSVGAQSTGRATLTVAVGRSTTQAQPDDPGLPVQSYLVTTPLGVLDATLVSLTLRFGESLHNQLPDLMAATLSEEFEGWVRVRVPSGTALLNRLAGRGRPRRALRAAIIEALDDRAAALQFSDPRSFRASELLKLATGIAAFTALPGPDVLVGVVVAGSSLIILQTAWGIGTGLGTTAHYAVTQIGKAMVDRVAQKIRAGSQPPP